MNLFTKTTTKFYLSVILLIVMTMVSNMVHAQKDYTTISKNINPEAESLYHDLSPKGDSLYLKGESIFYKVTFLNSLDRKVYPFNPPVLEGKIPLHDIIVGDYTVLVYMKDRIIVFHISRLLEIETPTEMIANHDMNIEKPLLSNSALTERPISKIVMNEIKNYNDMELEIKDLNVAINTPNLEMEKSTRSVAKSYDLSSMDRTNMQSRDEYRRNNVRPNGKPY